MKIKKKTLLFILPFICIAILAAIMLTGKSEKQNNADDKTKNIDNILDAYTWEEYATMTPEQKKTFSDEFDTTEAFEAWYEDHRPRLPWEEGGKEPGEYSWTDFSSLTSEQQEAFEASFDSEYEFEDWMSAVMPSAPWETEEKQPNEYTWEEYAELSLEYQDQFFSWFDTEEEFLDWVESVKVEETEPVFEWTKIGKTPDAYSWEEYEDLSLEEQEAFYQWFGSVEAFEDWRSEVKEEEVSTEDFEWTKDGKDPDAYSWDEYEALSVEEQEAFYQWFKSTDSYENWMNQAKAKKAAEDFEWTKSGKTPDAYNWDEYEALSAEEQEAFYQWFESMEAFESWMDQVKPEETKAEDFEWTKSGKTPDAYSWDEYEALSAEEQEAFYQWFGSMEAFEDWRNQARGFGGSANGMKWTLSEKSPDGYSWEEYMELSSMEQEAFYQWFGSMEAFEDWMYEAKESAAKDFDWTKTGKTPDAYSWQEYEELSSEEQEAFYQWFGSVEAFEDWMESVNP